MKRIKKLLVLIWAIWVLVDFSHLAYDEGIEQEISEIIPEQGVSAECNFEVHYDEQKEIVLFGNNDTKN